MKTGDIFTFNWYEFASKTPEWSEFKKYDGQSCKVVNLPENSSENIIIEFEDGNTIGVQDFELEKIENVQTHNRPNHLQKDLLNKIKNKIDEIESFIYNFEYFYVNSGGDLINIYYNPDSNCGGQIVKDVYNISDVLSYYMECNCNISKFDISNITELASEYLYDFYDEEGNLIIDYSFISSIVNEFKSSTPIEKILESELKKYYISQSLAIRDIRDNEISADILAEIFMDDKNSTYGMYEKFISEYEDGGFSDGYEDRASYQAGMEKAFEILLNISLKDIAKQIGEEIEHKKEIEKEENENEERDL